jgi:Tfp pilus assembly protein PilF
MRMNLAFTLLRLRDPGAALQQYDEILRTDPRDADAWGLKGSLLSEQGKHAEAIQSIERAVGIAAQDAGLIASLGQARENSGDMKGALADYDRALAIDPGEKTAIIQKALLLAHQSNAGDAASVLRAGLEHHPDDAEILNNLAWILVDQINDPAQALELARRALAQSPDDPAFLDTFGWAAVRSGKAREGIVPLRKALSATKDPVVRAHLGVALHESGESEGIEEVQRALREEPALMDIPEVRRITSRLP